MPKVADFCCSSQDTLVLGGDVRSHGNEDGKEGIRIEMVRADLRMELAGMSTCSSSANESTEASANHTLVAPTTPW